MGNRKITEKPVKRTVRVAGTLQFPVKVGEAACYWNGEIMLFTDTVKKILEIAAGYAKLETTSYYYTIETDLRGSGQRRMAA